MSRRDIEKSGDDLTTRASKVSSTDTGEREDYKILVKDALERYSNYLASQCEEHNTESSSNNSQNDPDTKKPMHQSETPAQPPFKPEVISIPERSDILFGRGKNERNHFGNRYLRTICRERLSIYEVADREEKTEISKDIVKEIQSSGGRFLKLNNARDGWLVVNDEDARRKVSHLMRDARQIGGGSK